MRVGGGLWEVSLEEAVEGVIPSALAAVVEVGAIGAFLWMGIGGMFGLAFINLLVEGVDGGFCSSSKRTLCVRMGEYDGVVIRGDEIMTCKGVCRGQSLLSS